MYYWHLSLLSRRSFPSAFEECLNVRAFQSARNYQSSIWFSPDLDRVTDVQCWSTINPLSLIIHWSIGRLSHRFFHTCPAFTSGFGSRDCRWAFYQHPCQVLRGPSAETNHRLPHVHTSRSEVFPPLPVSEVRLILSGLGSWAYSL